jgi:hypothetical protein
MRKSSPPPSTTPRPAARPTGTGRRQSRRQRVAATKQALKAARDRARTPPKLAITLLDNGRAIVEIHKLVSTRAAHEILKVLNEEQTNA